MEAAMAQRTVVRLVSDLSGEELVEGEGRTIRFSYDGAEYTIDLTTEEAEQFDEVMADYIDAATVVGGRRSSSRRSRRGSSSSGGSSKEELGNIRAWARANGYEISDRGRIRAEIVEAYHAANG
jgi:hypothetical protein